jgi:hypothetical protein
MGRNFHWSIILAYGCSMRRAKSRIESRISRFVSLKNSLDA